ncbi:uncharacterized protein LOC119725495 [Patiria miniata]|uniref:Ubiquitin-like domain-containing protein n=1 Tax=Patiria miniata TaxID=46514 RepID=A0A913ZM08_PATMI|nr:uncharacterized protein LOC119725495 [Patiria miniata]
MPQKTIQQLEAYIKATAVVYDHSNTKLVSRKTKVSRRRKEAFLSVLPYRKPSSHYHSHERKTSSSLIAHKPRSKPSKESALSNPKQKLQISVRIPENTNDDAAQTLSFQLDPGTPVQSLKELIEKQIGVEARHQRLCIQRNFQICDLLTLEDNGVEKDEIIYLHLSTEDQDNDDVTKDKAKNDDEYLKDLSSKIESSWKEVAKHLGYEKAEIADIQTTNEGSTEQSRHMLLTWWKKTPDRDEAAQKLRRAMEAIGLTDLAKNVPVTSESRDEAAGPEPERRQDAGVDEESKQNGAASTEEEKLKKEQVGDQDKPQLISFRYVTQRLQVFLQSHVLHKPKTLCFQVDRETSVLTLKEMIDKKIGVQPQQQRLYIRRNFRNFELSNLLTLHDCGIHQDENISLRLCTDGLLGGGPKGECLWKTLPSR